MIELRGWSEQDLELLRRLNSPEMTEHLGGPESEEKLIRRHRRYLAAARSPTDRVFTIVLQPEEISVGCIVYWETSWRGEQIFETGWSVLPDYQGRGIAGKAAAAVVEKARSERKHRFMHAFPSVTNAASNAICRKLGFKVIEECEVEYPPGHLMRCNDWRLDLLGDGSPE